MAATLHRLRTAPDRLREDQATQLRQAVLAFPGLPERAAGELLAAIDRQTTSSTPWSFVLMDATQNAAVVSWLATHSSRPIVALRLWSELFVSLDRRTGEVLRSREELAEAVGETPGNVSRVITELETIGAVSRQRRKVPGLKGPGMVAYFLNPNVGTHLGGAARDKAQSEAGFLKLVPQPVP